MCTHSIHLFNFNYIPTPPHAPHLSEALAVSLHTISLSIQWYLSPQWLSIPFSQSHPAPECNYGFWTTTIVSFFFFLPNLAHKSLINLFVLTQRLNVRNELWKGTNIFGSKIFPGLFSSLLCVNWSRL